MVNTLYKIICRLFGHRWTSIRLEDYFFRARCGVVQKLPPAHYNFRCAVVPQQENLEVGDKAMTLTVRGKVTVITEEVIKKTRKHFAEIENDCTREQLKLARERKWSAASHVNIDFYVAFCRERAVQNLAGDNDHTVTFIQCAYWIQTGECVALLS
jgi:hypothetical protein